MFSFPNLKAFCYSISSSNCCFLMSEVSQSCLTLCDSMDYSLPGFSIHGIFQARILEWVAISFSRRTSRPRDWTHISHTVGRRFTIWATGEVLLNLHRNFSGCKSSVWYSCLLKNFPVCCDPHSQRFWHSQQSKSRCFPGTLLLFRWSSRCWQFDLWFLCLF